MNKIQKLNFSSVDEFLDYLPENELNIVRYLREIVLDCIPACKEKLAYNVPYYWRNSRICYIWPPSIPWGNVKIAGVQFGFCYGYLLNDEINFLERGSRKQVYWKSYSNLKEIDLHLLKSFIYEAVEIDSQLRNTSRKNPF